MQADITQGDALTSWQELKRGWRQLLACSVGIGLGLSPLPPFTSGLFATALTEEFGWPRGQILGSIIVVTIALLILGPFVGRLVDRIGARKVAIGSTFCLGVAIAGLSLINDNILSFYAGWLVIAIFALGTLPLTYAKVVMGWFTRARGVALGIALASTGITGALYPYYVGFLMEGYGWRTAYVGMGLLPLIIALPILFLWLREAEPIAASADAPAPALTGMSVRDALHSYRFWASAMAAMALGAGTGGLMPNLGPVLGEGGMDAAHIQQALAVLAISVTAGRLLSGFMLDRLWAPVVALLLVAPACAAVMLLASGGVSPAVALVAVAVIGLVAGAEFDLVAYITGRYFGRKHFSEIYAMQYAIFGLGSGASPAIYGFIRDGSGSYMTALYMSLTLLALGVALLFTLGRYPARNQYALDE